jgi:hypothetical protein
VTSNQLVVEATINDVEHDLARGWFRVKTDKARFDTKIPEKAQEALSLRGKTVRIWYTEQPSQNINPHTNQPYAPSRYYERAEEVMPAPIGDGFSVPQQPQAQAQAQPQARPQFSPPSTGGEDPRKTWRICLQSGAKLAVWTMPLMPNEQRTFETQKQIALAWAKWFWVTPPPASDRMGDERPVPTPQQAYDERPVPVGAPQEEVTFSWERDQQNQDIPF